MKNDDHSELFYFVLFSVSGIVGLVLGFSYFIIF